MKSFKVIFLVNRTEPAMTGFEFETREAAEEAITIYLANHLFQGFLSECPATIRLYK